MKAIIFGASGGIGSAVAKKCAANGWELLLAARDETKLRNLSSEIPSASFKTCDVRFVEQVDSIIKEAAEVDAICLSVGSLLLKPAHLTTNEDWELTVTQNLTPAFYVLRAAMKFNSGRPVSLLFFSSVAARIGLANHEAIAAAKGGVEALVRSAAATYALRGVRVNAIAPGLVATPLTARITGNEASLAASQAMHPLGRIGTPEDIAEAAYWLMSPASSWVTGQVISLDGGMSTIRVSSKK